MITFTFLLSTIVIFIISIVEGITKKKEFKDIIMLVFYLLFSAAAFVELLLILGK